MLSGASLRSRCFSSFFFCFSFLFRPPLARLASLLLVCLRRRCRSQVPWLWGSLLYIPKSESASQSRGLCREVSFPVNQRLASCLSYTPKLVSPHSFDRSFSIANRWRCTYTLFHNSPRKRFVNQLRTVLYDAWKWCIEHTMNSES